MGSITEEQFYTAWNYARRSPAPEFVLTSWWTKAAIVEFIERGRITRVPIWRAAVERAETALRQQYRRRK